MKTAIRILIVAAAIGLFCMPAFAQCAMCRVAVTSATNGVTLMRSLNLASLVLLIPPVGIFCVIFGMAFKQRQRHEQEEGDEGIR